MNVLQQMLVAYKTPAGGGGTPTFVSELTSDRETSVDNSATTVHTLAGGCAATHTLCVFIGWISATQTVSTVTDSKGNSYTVHTASAAWDGGNGKLCWASGYMTTALVATDTVTVTWGSPAFTYRVLAFIDVSGAASAGQPDQQTTAIGTDGFPSAAAATTAANTCLIGVVGVGSQARTLDSAAWTISGAVHDWPDGTDRSYYVYKNASANGSQNPSGVLNTDIAWGVAWIALK